MKKIVVVMMVCLFAFSATGFADNHGTSQDEWPWNEKLGRGLLNIATGFFEVPREINRTTQDEGLAYGWSIGLIQGTGLAVTRMAAGAIDLLTCPFNYPDENKAPLLMPEYSWQEGRTKI